MAPREADRIASAQQTLDSTLLFNTSMNRESKHFLVLYDISQLFGTQLDKETLATCIGMIESGVNPEALAVSVRCLHCLLSLRQANTGRNPRIKERRCSYRSYQNECSGWVSSG